MKKIKIYFALMLLCLIPSLFLTTYAAEVGDTYSYTNGEGNSLNIVLISDTDCAATVEVNGEKETKILNYIFDEDGKLILTDEDAIISIVIGDENVIVDATYEYIQKYNASINCEDVDGGVFIVDKIEGNAGDVVKVIPKPEFLYDLKQVIINGVIVEPNEDGEYEFVLLEGENLITGTFAVDEEKLAVIADLLQKAKKGSWDEIFTVSNILKVVSWVLTSFFGVGFFVSLYRGRKFKAKTINEIVTEIENVTNTKMSEGTKQLLESVLLPLINIITEKIDDSNNAMHILVKCFILMQDGTSDSKLAILNELTKLNNNQDELSAQVKKIIEDELAKKEENKNELNKSIEKMEKLNESIEIKTNEEDHL